MNTARARVREEHAAYNRTIGWRIRRVRKVGKQRVVEYATGACTWAPEKRRAFLFTTFGHPEKARGLNDGYQWASAHRKTLPYEKFTRVSIVRVFVLQKKDRDS